MEITILEKQKKAKNRYNVYLDGEYAFSLYDDTLVKFALYESKQLTVGQIEEIKAFDLSCKCLNSAFNILSQRMHSEHELYYKLIKKFTNQEVVPTLIRLKELKYIDDYKFSQLWLDSRQKSRGRRLVKQELILKGVDRETIERVFLENPESEEELQLKASSLLLKRYPKLEELSREEKYKKIYSFLTRKGFEHNTISKVFNQYK